MKCVAAILSLLLLPIACSRSEAERTDVPADPVLSRPAVAATILPQRYFLKRLLGESCSVMIMVPPGSSPELYAPSPDQMKGLAATALYVRMGHLALETAWLEKFRSSSPDMAIINPSVDIEFMTATAPHHHGPAETQHHEEAEKAGGIDPHIWLSPVLMIHYSQNLALELIKAFPHLETTIQKNLTLLSSEIEQLHQDIHTLLEPHRGKAFAVYHPAWAYFARDYGLQQWAIENEGKSPSPRQMKKMADLVREKGIRTIFIQNQFERRSAETVAESLGISVVELDPLAENWPVMMQNTARLIAASFTEQ